MNHIKWAAWGVVDLDGAKPDGKPNFDRQQRRNYLRKVRAELEELKYVLQPGGSTTTPWYMATSEATGAKKAFAGTGAFSKVCAWVLDQLGVTADVGSEDGGVRCAGDEAQVGVADVAGR